MIGPQSARPASVYQVEASAKVARRMLQDAETSQRVGMTHYWRVRARLPERFGQLCRVIAFGRLNSCLVEFGDGVKVITCRYYVRRLRPDAKGGA
jgi:hypothetical protein